MARQHPSKPPHRTDTVTANTHTEPEAAAKEIDGKPEVSLAAPFNSKKEVLPARSKKQSAAPSKNGSLLPSAYKLEHLKAAVAAAGGAEKLLVILHHVEEAGGKSEVTESIEAYRVLKTVLEE